MIADATMSEKTIKELQVHQWKVVQQFMNFFK